MSFRPSFLILRTNSLLGTIRVRVEDCKDVKIAYHVYYGFYWRYENAKLNFVSKNDGKLVLVLKPVKITNSLDAICIVGCQGGP